MTAIGSNLPRSCCWLTQQLSELLQKGQVGCRASSTILFQGQFSEKNPAVSAHHVVKGSDSVQLVYVRGYKFSRSALSFKVYFYLPNLSSFKYFGSLLYFFGPVQILHSDVPFNCCSAYIYRFPLRRHSVLDILTRLSAFLVCERLPIACKQINSF